MSRTQQDTQPKTLRALLRQLDEQGVTDFRRYDAVRKFLSFKAREKNIPISGSFELTPLCNLDCKMCYVHLNKNQLCGKTLLTVDQWKSLMDQAVSAGMLDAILTGGECLTYPGFDELYLFLQERGIQTTVLTNGLLLTEERIAFFSKYPPKAIQISLYGSSEEEYEAVTGHRCFERVLSNIRNLKGKKIPVALAITPNRFLPDGGEALVKLAHELGLWYTINTALFRPREETGRKHDQIEIEQEGYIRLQLLRRMLNGKPASACAACTLPEPAKTGKPVRGLLCSAGNSSFDICWDGTMRPCSSFEDVAAYPLQTGFESAWKEIRAASLSYPLPAECMECAYRTICPACVIVHQQDAPVGHASKIICARAKRIVSSGLIELSALQTKKGDG